MLKNVFINFLKNTAQKIIILCNVTCVQGKIYIQGPLSMSKLHTLVHFILPTKTGSPIKTCPVIKEFSSHCNF